MKNIKWALLLSLIMIIIVGLVLHTVTKHEPGHILLTQEKINEYKEKGYTEEDIYQAYSLTFNTDLSMTNLLQINQDCSDWGQVIDYLKQTGQYQAPEVVTTGQQIPPLSTDQRKVFFKKHFTFKDMDKAHQVMNTYGLKEEEIVKLKKDYTNWENISLILKQTYSKRPDRYVEISIPPGLNYEQVTGYLAQGYAPEQIQEVDYQVRRTGKTPQEIISQMMPENGQ